LFDPETSAEVTRGMRLMESAFAASLVRAREAGEIPPDADTGALAAYLLNAVQGLFVIGKVGPQRQRLEQIVEVTFSVLPPGKGQTALDAG